MKKTFAPRISLNNLPFYGIATGAAFAAAPLAADAAVIYNYSSITLTSGSIFWDVDGAGNGFQFRIAGGSDDKVECEGPGINQFVSDGFNRPLPIALNDTVDGTKHFKSYHDYVAFVGDGGNVSYNGPNFGFRFMIDDEVHYGWVNVSMIGGANPSLTINYWAYEDLADTGIAVIPEPSTTGSRSSLSERQGWRPIDRKKRLDAKAALKGGMPRSFPLRGRTLNHPSACNPRRRCLLYTRPNCF